MTTLEEKQQCLKLSSSGMNSREIYESYYSILHPEIKYSSFRTSLQRWRKTGLADTDTLVAGTYPNFEAHGATVQVNRMGEVVQAWIKQHGIVYDMSELIEAIKKHTHHTLVEKKHYEPSVQMLEIPMYDMHFPLSNYQKRLDKLIYLIDRYHYDEINVIIGQDLFHNDDFRGRTSSGRSIEKVDIAEAWDMAEEFWYNVLYYSLEKANKVNLIYSKGNHDEALAWAFCKRLAALLPEVHVDDSMDQRKCIHWNRCFIGITHGHMKKNKSPISLRNQFTIQFPQQFAGSDVREIHAGHEHHEEAGDIAGVVVRRLSTAVPTDEWSDDEGYIGAHKRFMIFEWTPGELDSIHFI